MAVVSRFYKNNIAEGKGMLVFSVLIAAILRAMFYLWGDSPSAFTSDGYLWEPLAPIFENPLYSFIGSSLLLVALAVLVSHINTEHVLIRRRTVLPPAVIILLFSCHPAFIHVSPALLSTWCILQVVSVLFTVYNTEEKARAAFRVAFILALGSLFAPVLLVYVPLSWIALMMMRCFKFKSIIASLFGVFIIYFPAFSFYLFSNSLDIFYKPFLSILDLSYLPLFGLDNVAWGLLAFFVIVLSVIIGDNYINQYKDKIRIRAYLSLLSFTVCLSMLLFLFFNVSPDVNLYITVGVGSLLISHFFALVEKKSGTVLFYIFMLFYFVTCILSFMSFL